MDGLVASVPRPSRRHQESHTHPRTRAPAHLTAPAHRPLVHRELAFSSLRVGRVQRAAPAAVGPRRARRLDGLRPRVIRLDAGSWRLKLIAWMHTALGAVAVIPWNATRQKKRTCLPPSWTADALGKRPSTERFFGRVVRLFSRFRLQRPPRAGGSAGTSRVALTDAATVVVALPARQAGRPDLIRCPKRVLAHTWEGLRE